MSPQKRPPGVLFPGGAPSRPMPCKYAHFMHKTQIPAKMWVLASLLCLILCLAVAVTAVWAGNRASRRSSVLENSSLLAQAQSLKDVDFETNFIDDRNPSEIIVNHKINTKNDRLTFEYGSIVKEVKNEPEKILEISEDVLKIHQTKPIEKKEILKEIKEVIKEPIQILQLPIVKLNASVTNDEKDLKEMKKVSDKLLEDGLIKGMMDKSEGWAKYLKELYGSTQISSPDDAVGQVTTNLALASSDALAGILEEQPTLSNEHRVHKKDSAGPLSSQLDIPFKPVPSHVSQSDLQGDKEPSADFSTIYLSEMRRKNEDSYYDPGDYFYSERDAQAYYYDYQQNSWTDYLLEKIQELHDWIVGNMDNAPAESNKGEAGTIPKILRALNVTLLDGDAGVLLTRLKDIYHDDNTTIDFDPARTRRILTNTSSPISFGLLALDVMLLRNIQLMAWDDQEASDSMVFRDPEVFALNALFMDPEKVRVIYEGLEDNKAEGRDAIDLWQLEHRADDDVVSGELLSSFSENYVGQDIVDFAVGTARAAMHLGKAFRNARVQLENFGTVQQRSNENDAQVDVKTETRTISPRHVMQKVSNLDVEMKMVPMMNDAMKMVSNIDDAMPEEQSINSVEPDGQKMTELDCIWTLYCKNLDKTTKIDGAYGFLAKLNSLGLRLVVGELPMERAMDTLIEETFNGAKSLNCDNLFPRCSRRNASRVVLESILSMELGTKEQNDRKSQDKNKK